MPVSRKKKKVYTARYKSSGNLKRFILFFSIAVVIVAIPLTVRLAQEQQDTRSSAKTIHKTQSRSAQSSDVVEADYADGEILVKYNDSASVQSAPETTLRKINAKRSRRIDRLNIDVLEVAKGDEANAIAELERDPAVEYAEPDYIYSGTFMPNDSGFPEQWGLHNDGWGGFGKPDADIDVPEAWDVTRGIMPNGQAVKIAILDTGIDQTHPDLSSKIILNNNFVENPPGNATYDDVNGHGTAVAGIAAGVTNNVEGIAGVCPDCQLLNGKVLNDNQLGETSWVVDGIIWAADNGAKVINLSLGGYPNSQSITDAVSYARSKGAVVVAAARNEGSTEKNYPAASPNVIGVAAVDAFDNKADFSNYGTWVDVAAPGNDIYTTSAPFSGLSNTSDLYGYYWGTSMATPMVSGTVALIWARNGSAATPAQVENALFSTADAITGTGTNWSKGRINALAAVANPVPTSQPTLPPSTKYMISGLVYIDSNRNGKKDTTEVGYQGATVQLTGGSSGATNSISSGKYAFTGLTAQTYTVVLTVPSGYSAVGSTNIAVKLTKKKSKKVINFGIAPL